LLLRKRIRATADWAVHANRRRSEVTQAHDVVE
jgi:hypothetical protein